jgi:penicillin-binding protein 1A
MRIAHQGVTPAPLPPNMQALASGNLTQIASQITLPAQTPPQVASQTTTGAARPAPTRTSARPEPAAGLDGWLMDRLFGGR